MAGAQDPEDLVVRVGGFRPADIADPRVRAAASFGVAQLRRHAVLASIDSARKRVAQGTSYRLDVTLTDRSRWRLAVFEPLPRQGEMTAAPPIRLRRTR